MTEINNCKKCKTQPIQAVESDFLGDVPDKHTISCCNYKCDDFAKDKGVEADSEEQAIEEWNTRHGG